MSPRNKNLYHVRGIHVRYDAPPDTRCTSTHNNRNEQINYYQYSYLLPVPVQTAAVVMIIEPAKISWRVYMNGLYPVVRGIFFFFSTIAPNSSPGLGFGVSR